MDQNNHNNKVVSNLENSSNEVNAAKIITTASDSIKINQGYTQQASAETPIYQQNPMHFVLQWITYALWGWTLLVLSFVIFNLVLSIVSDVDMGEGVLYPISALLILLPASIIADVFYGRIETPIKRGGALIIMVIHAVIFILFMVGFLIAAVFSVVSMLLNTNNSTSYLGYMISSLLVALFYALLIVRTLKPTVFRKQI